MDADQAAEAARLLITARRDCTPLAELPADCRPGTEDEGYAVQEAFVAAQGGRVAGYKVGATSERSQAFLGTDGPFFGRVLASDVLESPARLRAADYPFRLVEPEFAVRLARDLPARSEVYARAEIAEAVAAIYPAFELVTSGLANWNEQGIGSVIADNGVDAALVLGRATESWRDLDLAAHQVTLRVNGELIGEGTGANALGHPLTALAWLANTLSQRGIGLAAGDLVTTGVVTPFHLLEAGDVAEADFGSLGSVSLRFD